jgi:hypothetical protein
MAREATLAQLRGLEAIRARQLENIRLKIGWLEEERALDDPEPEPAEPAEEKRFAV